ncbi:hypothetical protein OEZ86_006424 [Tetradesmus obliquus]|nr:hypothetical protein OEZ86_006424 [Tetradesmus obliquus]
MQPLANAADAELDYNRHVTFQVSDVNHQPALLLPAVVGTQGATVHGNDLDSASGHLQQKTSSDAGRGYENNGSTNPVPGDAPVVVPLSSVPLGALPDLPADGSSRDNSKHRHGRQHSKGGSSISSVSSKTGTTGTSRFREKVGQAAVHVNHPQQVTHKTPDARRRALAWLGRIGWLGKAVVYAMIGGLACQSAAVGQGPEPEASVGTKSQVTASPQGAFVLLGTTPGGAGIAVLLVMMVALLCYIAWRFGEAFLGQGYDRSFSSKKNFFKFRVSPFVSGAVYCSYLVFILQLLHTEVTHAPPSPAQETWPATWRHSSLGKAGLALLGLAFLIATCIQLQGVLSKQWHKDYRDDAPRWLMRTIFTIGHFGFAGRGAAFLAMAIMFFKDVADADDVNHTSSMVANALQQLQANRGLRAVLMIIGILLVAYGAFAVLSSWARVFPTQAPSRSRVVPAAQLPQGEDGDGDDDVRDDGDHRRRRGRRHLEMQQQRKEQQPAGHVSVGADAV